LATGRTDGSGQDDTGAAVAARTAVTAGDIRISGSDVAGLPLRVTLAKDMA